MGSFISETDVSYVLYEDFTFLEALERAEYPCRYSITCWFLGEVGLKGGFAQVVGVRGVFLCSELDCSVV